MFSKPANAKRPPASVEKFAPAAGSARHVPSIVAADMLVNGDISSEGEVHVDGKVHGDVSGKSVTIGEGAVVRGEVVADTVRLCGSVFGLIKAREVVLTRTAHLEGDVHHETLAVEAGAQIEGNCQRLRRTEAAAPAEVAISLSNGNGADHALVTVADSAKPVAH